MIGRTAILSSVAAIGICTAAFAQSGYDDRYGNGPPVSTPEEMQQTDQLNQQQTNDAASANASQIQYQSQYQDQVQQYNDQMQHYQAMQQRYRYDRERYNEYLTGYYLGPYGWNYPAPVWGYPPP